MSVFVRKKSPYRTKRCALQHHFRFVFSFMCFFLVRCSSIALFIHLFFFCCLPLLQYHLRKSTCVGLFHLTEQQEQYFCGVFPVLADVSNIDPERGHIWKGHPEVFIFHVCLICAQKFDTPVRIVCAKRRKLPS